jgi:hypothetical protein
MLRYVLTGRAGIVDVPNAVATLAVPLRIFSVDVRPKKLLPGVSVKVRVARVFRL